MARARWDAEQARQDAEEPARAAAMALAEVVGEGPVAPGDYFGTLQWHGADGRVRRWTVRRGRRAGQIEIDGVQRAKTASWLCDRLRKRLVEVLR